MSIKFACMSEVLKGKIIQDQDQTWQEQGQKTMAWSQTSPVHVFTYT